MVRKRISVFQIVNYFFLTLLIVICFVPILHVIALSFSEKIEAVAGHVGLIPVGFNLAAYQYVMEDSQFWTSLLLTFNEWRGVHPALVTIPVNWPFTVPYGLLYSRDISGAAACFLDIIRRRMAGENK